MHNEQLTGRMFEYTSPNFTHNKMSNKLHNNELTGRIYDLINPMPMLK